jgi:peroxiredoxin
MILFQGSSLSRHLFFLLVTLNIFNKVESADSISAPDLFFSVNALSIEQSGISKKIGAKYPYLRQWAESLNQDLNKSADVYDAIGLREEDFTHFSFRLDGLNSIYEASSADEIYLSQVYLEMKLEAQAPIDLSGFMNWLYEELAAHLKSKKAAQKVLVDQVIDEDQLQFTVDLNALESLTAGDAQDSISLDSNFSVRISLDKNQTNIRGFLTNPIKHKLMESGDFEKTALLSKLAPDKQISFYLRIPQIISGNYLPQSDEVPHFPPFIEGVKELGAGVSFTDQSIVIEFLIHCKDVDHAGAFRSFLEGSIGLAKIGLLQKHTSAESSLSHLLGQVESSQEDDWVKVSLDLNLTDLDEMISSQLKSISPRPGLQIYKDGPKSLTGKLAPPFTMTLLDGREFSLASKEGKAVVLFFWSTSSRPSLMALPMFSALRLNDTINNLSVLSINQDESVKEISRCLETHSLLHLPVGLDSVGSLGKSYLVDELPQTILINPKGEIERAWVGFSPFLEKDLFHEIDKILKN